MRTVTTRDSLPNSLAIAVIPAVPKKWRPRAKGCSSKSESSRPNSGGAPASRVNVSPDVQLTSSEEKDVVSHDRITTISAPLKEFVVCGRQQKTCAAGLAPNPMVGATELCLNEVTGSKLLLVDQQLAVK